MNSGLRDVNWFSAVGTAAGWSGADRALICLLSPPGIAVFERFIMYVLCIVDGSDTP